MTKRNFDLKIDTDYKKTTDLWFWSQFLQNMMALEQRLRKEIADLYVRAIIAEHALEAEKLTKEKLQNALDKIQHEQSVHAMKNYHERRQAALDYYKKKYEQEHGVKPDECDCGHLHCVHLGDDEID